MSLHAISVSAAWTAAGWTMLHLIWIGAVGGLAAAIVRRLLPRRGRRSAMGRPSPACWP